MIYLISYDISNNRIRTTVANKLIAFGLYRIQYSVFMGFMKKKHLSQLEAELQAILQKTNQDHHLFIVLINSDNYDKMFKFGNKELDWEEIAGKRKVIIF